MKAILVSACLTGLHTRYDATAKNTCLEYDNDIIYVPVCPEQLGGLPTPREPAEVVAYSCAEVCAGRTKVVTKTTRTDVSDAFYRGAEEALFLCKKMHIREAWLKSGSPSCGEEGIAATILKNNGISVCFKA